MNSYSRFKPPFLTKSFGVKVSKIIKKRRRFKSYSPFKNFFLPKFNSKSKKGLFLFPKLLGWEVLTTYNLGYETQKMCRNFHYNLRSAIKPTNKTVLKAKLFSFKKKPNKKRNKKRKKYCNLNVFFGKLEIRLGSYALNATKAAPLSPVSTKSKLTLRYKRTTYYSSLTRFRRFVFLKSRRRKKKKKTFIRIIWFRNMSKKKKKLLRSKTKAVGFTTRLISFKNMTKAPTSSKKKVRVSKRNKSFNNYFNKVNNTLLKLKTLNLLLYKRSRYLKKFRKIIYKQLLSPRLRLRYVKRLLTPKGKRTKYKNKYKKRKRARLFTFRNKKSLTQVSVRRLQLRSTHLKPTLRNRLFQVTNVYLLLFSTPLTIVSLKYKSKKTSSLNQLKFNTLFSFFGVKYIKQK